MKAIASTPRPNVWQVLIEFDHADSAEIRIPAKSYDHANTICDAINGAQSIETRLVTGNSANR